MFAKLGYYICVPFAFLTRLFYSWTGSYGVALILFTLVVKLVLLPFQLKSKKSMLRMNRMQGKIKDIQTRYANNQQRQQEAMQELYMKEGINPVSGCLWSMIPLPHSDRPVLHYPCASAVFYEPVRVGDRGDHHPGRHPGLHCGRGQSGV